MVVVVGACCTARPGFGEPVSGLVVAVVNVWVARAGALVASELVAGVDKSVVAVVPVGSCA